ncbi:MAG: glycosyltransferase family protein [Desulfobacterales bacterium]|nr:glycosyltransferase family protein [Desulfobacterales bacterium]
MNKKRKCIAIVQARLSSTRLPGKVLAPVAGLEILGHVLVRLAVCQNIDETVVATTVNPADDPLVDYLETNFPRIGCFRGEEDDVLDRYLSAARAFAAHTVVRVTSDSPLIDPAVVDAVAAVRAAGNYDYASNSLSPTLPDGLDAECFSMAALTRAWAEATRVEEREHVTPYLRMHPDRFSLANLAWHRNLSGLCWAVDTPADLDFVRQLAGHLDLMDPANYGFERVLAVLASHPQLADANGGAVRDHKLVEQLPQIFSAHGRRFDHHPLSLEMPR